MRIEENRNSTGQQAFEDMLVESYQRAADQYRRDDEIEVGTENHRRLCGNLRRISAAFGRSIRALDAGCGTGRHFHCLRNVESLVGLDLSAAMLSAAAHPVRKQEITVSQIHLQSGSLYKASFPSGSFDLIYSLGVFGHGTALTLELCRNFYDWLGQGGCLYLNVIEATHVGPWARAKRNVRNLVCPMLPQRLQQRMATRQPLFTLTYDQFEALLYASGFTDFTISHVGCRSPLWRGTHLECIACKGITETREQPMPLQ